MAKLLQMFDATKVDPSQGVGQLPIGRHPVIIVESEVDGNKAGNGGMLILTLKIIDGPQTGTTGPYRLNLYNQNPQACQIAERQMSAVCHAIGVYNVDDTQVMHNRPFMVEVGFQKGHEPGSSPDAKGYTEVKKVFDKDGNEPGKAGANKQQNNNAGQFDNQMAQAQQQQEQRQQNNAVVGNAHSNQGNGWGNGGNNAGQQQQNNGGGNGSWGNNGGGQQQPQQAQNQGGNGGGWGNQGGSNNNQGQQSPGGNNGGGSSWQQNANGAQGGGNSNGGWGQRN